MGLSIWNILGIEATSDISAIRSAYAAKLKTCRPDEDPVNFQKLREAYEAALSLAKAKKRPEVVFSISNERPSLNNKSEERNKESSAERQKSGNVSDDFPEPEEETDNSPKPGKDEIPDISESAEEVNARNKRLAEVPTERMTRSLGEDILQIFHHMDVLYSDFFRRIEIENWKCILESDIFWDIELRRRIRPSLLHFFVEHPALPKAVWILMDKEFEWSQNRDNQTVGNINDYSVLTKELDTRWDLDYTCFRKFGSTKNTDISASTDDQSDKQKDYAAIFTDYVEIRRNFRDAIIAGIESKITDLYESASSLFSDDPDLHRLFYEYKKAFGELLTFGLLFDIPVKTIAKLREFYPDNLEYEAAEADNCLLNKDYKKAARLYSRLVKRLPYHLDVAFHYGIAVGNLGKHKQSREIFKNIKKEFPKVEDNLSHYKSYIKGQVAVLNQISKNKQVIMQLKKIENY